MRTKRNGWMGMLAGGFLLAGWPNLVSAGEGKDGVSTRLSQDAEVVTFPWGTIRWLMNAKADPRAEMTLGIVEVAPNQCNPLHQHANSAEYVHVLSGSCEQFAEGKWVALKAGDTMRFPKGVPHQARTGQEACRMLIVYDTGTRQMELVEPGK